MSQDKLLRGVELGVWRDACMKHFEEQGVTSRNARSMAFLRAKNELLKLGYITISGSRVDTVRHKT